MGHGRGALVQRESASFALECVPNGSCEARIFARSSDHGAVSGCRNFRELCCALSFFLWLRRTLDSRSFAVAAAALLAFTPAFWLVTLQNHPYPLALLFLLLYFLCRHSPEDELPTTRRLIAAALFLAASALFHQAVALLIVPAAIVVTVYGKQDLTPRMLRSLLWSGAVFLLILGSYVWFWQTIDPDDSLLRWSSSYAAELHPPEILEMGVLPLFARAIAGFSGSLVQTDALKTTLADNLEKSQVFTLYTIFGLARLAGTVWWLARPGTRHHMWSLIRNSPLFALSALSVLSW